MEEVNETQKEETFKEKPDSLPQDTIKIPADSVVTPDDSVSTPVDTVVSAVDSVVTEEDTVKIPNEQDSVPAEIKEEPFAKVKEGEHVPEYLKPGVNVYGHYIYIPRGYSDSQEGLPLIIFLHGVGEKGNSKKDKNQLSNVLRTGVPALIENGEWDPGYPAIVVSPQCHEGNWKPSEVHKFIEYITAKYNVDKSRIYMTGISMGGIGTFEYLGSYGESSYVAAAVPICGGGNVDKASSFLNIPIWAFHGEADKVVSMQGSKRMVNAINELNPHYKSLLTIFPNVGHISWTITYNGKGMGKESRKYDPFKEDVFKWMYKFTKS